MKKLSTFIIAVAALCSLSSVADATSIIAIKTGDDIFIGADSKVLIEKDVSFSQCKITKMSDIFLVFTGMPSLPASTFNAYEIAEKSFSGKGSISSRVAAYDKTVHAKLETAFDQMRLKEPQIFAKWYAPDVVNRVAMQVLIAGPEKKGTVLSMLEYRIISPKDAPVKLKAIRQDIVTKHGSSQPKILILGMQDAINDLMKKKDFFSDFDEVRNINAWITAEAEAEPTKVSAPIDILKISPKKTEWIQHKAQCPEVEESKVKPAPAKK